MLNSGKGTFLKPPLASRMKDSHSCSSISICTALRPMHSSSLIHAWYAADSFSCTTSIRRNRTTLYDARLLNSWQTSPSS